MAYTIEKVEVWAGAMKDEPGGLAAKLDALAAAGANLEFVVARRDKPGRGIVFLAPLSGAKVRAAAKKAGLGKTDQLQALRIVGGDKAGLGAALTGALAAAGINVRGLSAMALGKKIAVYVALDSKADAAKAKRVLSKVLGGK